MDWNEAQKWEQGWWGDCANTLFEQEKQVIYAEKMGLKFVGNEKTPYEIDLKGKSVLDIGGGATSILLMCRNFVLSEVVDPLPLPRWVEMRYEAKGVKYERILGEEVEETDFNEVWIYNVLQHTKDPSLIIKRAKKAGKLIRLFEWIDTPISDGHIHTLDADTLDKWLGGFGKVEKFNKRPLVGTGYYGIFV